MIELQISRFWYVLNLCALLIAYVNPRGLYVSLSLEVGNALVMLSYFEAKYQKCPISGAISHTDVVFFLFFLKLSQVLASYALCCMFLSLCLACPQDLKSPCFFPNVEA